MLLQRLERNILYKKAKCVWVAVLFSLLLYLVLSTIAAMNIWCKDDICIRKYLIAKAESYNKRQEAFFLLKSFSEMKNGGLLHLLKKTLSQIPDNEIDDIVAAFAKVNKIDDHIPMELVKVYPRLKWKEISLPILTSKPYGRLGNAMGEYATLFTLNLLYNTSVVLHPSMKLVIAKRFPYITMATRNDLPITDLFHKLHYEMTMYNYKSYHLASAGLLGPDLFLLGGSPFELELFQKFKGDLLKEFVFSPNVSLKTNQFLESVLEMHQNKHGGDHNKTVDVTFIGVHIRRSDYPKHILAFGGEMPTEAYIKTAMEYYSSKYINPIYILASEDRRYLTNNFLEHENIYISKGYIPVQDMSNLAACNHSIITLGSFGFWCGFLAGGEVVYPEVNTTKPYKFSTPFYRSANISNFTPMPGN